MFGRSVDINRNGYKDGTGQNAAFYDPLGLDVDAAGNVYVADSMNHRIRKVSPAGVVTTLAGSTKGYVDGAGAAAQFNWPSHVAVDAAGNVYVNDVGNSRIRKVSPSGAVTTLEGSTAFCEGDQSPPDSRLLPGPCVGGVAVDGAGNVYVTSFRNHRIDKLGPDSVVTALAGSGVKGYEDGIGTAAKHYRPQEIAVDAAGELYVLDRGMGQGDERIRQVSPTDAVTTLFLTSDLGRGGITGVAVDAAGNIYATRDRGVVKIQRSRAAVSVSR